MNGRLTVTRQLPIHPSHVAHYAQYMATQLQQELALAWKWATPTSIEFEASSGMAKGVKGTLTFEGCTVTLNLDLPFMLAAMKPMIEKKINERLDAVEQMARSAAAAG